MRRQREEEDYWDEYEDYSLEPSSDESECDEPSPDLPSSDEEEGVLLESKKRTFEPVCKSDAGGYLCGVRGCGSSATKDREIRRKKELEKSASHTRSIVEMFSAQQNKGHPFSKPLSLPDLSQSSSSKVIQKVETRVELQTQAAHDVGELLRLKTQQMDKYGYELSPKSNYYCRHQMVRSFLWIQLNKEKDNPQLNRRKLAQIVAQSFNKRRYTERKIVQWERSWVKLRVIPNTKAGNGKGDLS